MSNLNESRSSFTKSKTKRVQDEIKSLRELVSLSISFKTLLPQNYWIVFFSRLVRSLKIHNKSASKPISSEYLIDRKWKSPSN